MRTNNFNFTIFTFGFVLYVVVAINIFFSIISQQNFIVDLDFNNLELGFESGFFTINKTPIVRFINFGITYYLFAHFFLPTKRFRIF